MNLAFEASARPLAERVPWQTSAANVAMRDMSCHVAVRARAQDLRLDSRATDRAKPASEARARFAHKWNSSSRNGFLSPLVAMWPIICSAI